MLLSVSITNNPNLKLKEKYRKKTMLINNITRH